ncbi:MAG: hypothetical protein HN576_02580 [Bacteriovoracaceae bacterium]|jgi:hypothetical protein|nr:hypothetical protein [Bacteriovoracaceae bacterium]
MTTNPPLGIQQGCSAGRSFNDLAHVLKDKILEYRKARPQLSSQQIAKKFDIPNSTFNRLENLTIKVPNFDQAIKVLSGTGHEKEILPYFEEFYPNLADTYKKGLGSNQVPTLLDEDATNYLLDQSSSKLMIIALSSSGLKKSVVIEEFGKSGLRTVERLIEKGILKENEFETYFPRENGSNLSIKDTQTLISRSLSQFFDINGYENKTSLNNMNFQSESIDLEKAYPLIINLTEEFQKAIREIFKNPIYKGEETVFVSSFTDSLLKNNLIKGNI